MKLFNLILAFPLIAFTGLVLFFGVAVNSQGCGHPPDMLDGGDAAVDASTAP